MEIDGGKKVPGIGLLAILTLALNLMLAGPSNTSLDITLSSSLAALSRNASVISTSSSDSGPSPLNVKTPRPRPIRTFSSPRSRSPHSPINKVKPSSYLNKELEPSPSNIKTRSKSRGRNVSINDFVIGETLGEGSYSSVSPYPYIFENTMLTVDFHRSCKSLISPPANCLQPRCSIRDILSGSKKWPWHLWRRMPSSDWQQVIQE